MGSGVSQIEQGASGRRAPAGAGRRPNSGFRTAYAGHRARPSRARRSRRRPLAAVIAAGLVVLLAPSCVISSGLHVVATPNPPSNAFIHASGKLAGMSAVSATDVWAAGTTEYQHVATGWQSLTLHWDGKSWRIVPTPGISLTSELMDIAAVAPNNVWAVGQQAVSTSMGVQVKRLLLHFTGSKWAVMASPPLPNSAGLRGIAAVSAGDIWAVGWLRVGASPLAIPEKTVPLTLHFDGTTWRQVPFPVVAGPASFLTRVAVSKAGRVYAVGGGRNAGGPPIWLPNGSRVIARYDAGRWTLLPLTGIQPDAELRDVAVAGPDVWVVGDRANAAGPIESLAWRYAGTRWTSYRPGPHPRGVLNGVHAASAREVWAAGTPGNDGTGDGVLLTRWDGQRWKVAFRIPTLDALRGLADVTTAGGHVFSVGGTTQTLAVQN